MERTVTISIIINILFFILGGYVLHKKGGIHYLKTKYRAYTESSSSMFGSFYDIKKEFFENMPDDNDEIIFIGDSIIEMCDWNELLRNDTIKNRGISGDIINGVIFRLDEVVRSNPRKIFVMIGTNDLGKKRSVAQILTDYEELIRLITQGTPQTELYLQSILPTTNRPDRDNEDIITINTGIFELSKKYSATYINLFDLFKTKDNELNMRLSYDGLHLNVHGYLLWKNALNIYL